MIGSLIGIFVVIIIIALIIRENNKTDVDKNNQNNMNANIEQKEEKYVDIEKDGTKTNKSSKLKETKK